MVMVLLMCQTLFWCLKIGDNLIFINMINIKNRNIHDILTILSILVIIQSILVINIFDIHNFVNIDLDKKNIPELFIQEEIKNSSISKSLIPIYLEKITNKNPEYDIIELYIDSNKSIQYLDLIFNSLQLIDIDQDLDNKGIQLGYGDFTTYITNNYDKKTQQAHIIAYDEQGLSGKIKIASFISKKQDNKIFLNINTNSYLNYLDSDEKIYLSLNN